MITIAIPVYNEQDSIIFTIEKLKNEITDLPIKEILIIDDGSSDNTAEQLAKISDIKLITHPYNIGYGAALKTALRNASGEYVLFLDSDGQHNPEDIKKICSHIPKYDMIVGQRGAVEGSPLVRWPGKIMLTKFASWLAEFDIKDINSGFRAVNREKALKFIAVYPNGFSITTTMTMTFIKAGFTIFYEPITVMKRIGTSTLKPLKDGTRTLLLILKTIVMFHPMKLFFPASVFLFLAGCVSLIFEFMHGLNIPDSAILLYTASMLMFFFGLLADMISTVNKGEKF